ncbi:beta-galactosidase [Fictibacillus sp. KU28468]|uniref:beta-galactosidase n=1 Tax=Fictibacillus sp. KU28468 TaxID=2991053 RepID=UPI00223E84F3|nr:beta-galactosidase [Fictibacillus sp. KU28468]UZJ79233.1 beta-galactosidase [Fictibacillus sp. KU28468]
MFIGVDYYPEQWPKSRWPEDVRLMKELGVNVVRIAEFGWQLMEPEEGVYDFSLFDEAIDLLTENGIKIILGTPTAAPPAWMAHQYPEILPVDENGVKISFGARRHYTVNSKTYQKFTRKIVRKLAEKYGQHPDVIGWQTDNEYGHEKSDRSYGDEDRMAFQEWLSKKYGSLEALNEAWGTVFWSQTYTAWEQIPVPRKVFQEHNPGLLLDFDRFCADSYTAYNKLQADILREHISDQQFITHNFVFTELALKQRDIAKDLDFISFDNYPVWGGLPEPIPPAAIAQQHDLCRSTKDGKGYWVLEELSGAQGWSHIGYLPRSGHIKLWTYQAIARGAEAIVYFRWRAARFGTEEFCHGILDHDGKPRRKFEEVKEVFNALKIFGDEWIATKYKAEVGVYYDVENAWAWRIQPQSDAFTHKQEMLRFYSGAYRLNAATDMVSPESSLDGLKTVIVPVYFLTNPVFTEKLKKYAADGGTVVLSYRAGVKEPNNAVTEMTLPGELGELAGIEVHEYESLQNGQQTRVTGIAGNIMDIMSPATVWCDLIEPKSAEVLAVYRDAFYEGTPAITKNKYGKGNVYYIGTAVEDYFLVRLYRDIFAQAGVQTIELPDDVEMVIRDGEAGSKFLCLLNHSTTASHRVSLPKGTWKDAMTGETFKGDVRLQSLGSFLLIQ